MITIIYAKLVDETWLCWLELAQGITSWMLPATAPGDIIEEHLLAHFVGQEDQLWALAEEKRHPLKLCGNVPTAALIRPLMLAIIDELNFIRENPGTHLPLTEGDLLTSVKQHLREC